MAFFATSNTTAVSLSANTEVNGNVFNSGGSAFTITASPTSTLTVSGVGITNNSGTTQNFVTAVDTANNFGTIAFTNSATAGSLTAFTVYGGDGEAAPGSIVQFSGTSTASNATFSVNRGINGTYAGNSTGGLVEFLDSSTAGNGIFTLDDADNFNGPGIVNFFGTSTAGNGTFTLVSGTSGPGAQMNFHDSSSAGNGIFTITVAENQYGGAIIAFYDTSTAGNGTFTVNGSDGTNGGTVIGNAIYIGNAGNATVIANGGLNGGSGGTIHTGYGVASITARIEVFGNGLGDYTSGNLNIDTDGQNIPPFTIGSIEGNGVVFLGAQNLMVGNNNLSTTFSGLMQDGPYFGTGGSLTKIGNGKLTLSKANTYTGGTTVSKGTLLVTNRTGSATGTGAVQVNKGTLGGTGIITGAVTAGTGRNSGAILLPGKSATAPGILTINSALTFNSRSTYKCVLNRRTPIAGEITALGVTINSGASFMFVDAGTGTLTVGTVLTVINNASANPISGAFSNLANGSVFTSNGNNFQASYTGGNGNDLTLTVVP
jgi:autotransporter-associated beta strand protein